MRANKVEDVVNATAVIAASNGVTLREFIMVGCGTSKAQVTLLEVMVISERGF